MTRKSNIRRTKKIFISLACFCTETLSVFFKKKYLVITTYIFINLIEYTVEWMQKKIPYRVIKYLHVFVPLSSIYFSFFSFEFFKINSISLDPRKKIFTKNPEAAPVRVRNKRTATVVRPNQPMEENILDNFSPTENSRPTEEENGTKKQVKTPQLDKSWITDFGEYFPDHGSNCF